LALLEFEGTPDYKKREKGEIKYNFPRKQSKSRKARRILAQDLNQTPRTKIQKSIAGRKSLWVREKKSAMISL